MQQYEVVKVNGSSNWQSSYGPMIGWQITCRNIATGGEKFCEINSKPDKVYKVGDTFWADVVGERAGVPKLKRVQPPQDQGGAAPQGKPYRPAEQGSQTQSQSGVEFNEALTVFMNIARAVDAAAPDWAVEEVKGGWSSTLFIAWQNGKVQRPPSLAAQQVDEPYPGNLLDEDVPF